MALSSGKLQRMFELEADNELLREDLKVLQQRFHRATEEAAKANASKESLERLVRVLEAKNGQPGAGINTESEETLEELARTRDALKVTEGSLKQCTEERTQSLNRVRDLEGELAEQATSTNNLVEDLELKLVEAQGELENLKQSNQSSERAKTKALRELEAAREYMVSQQRMMEMTITELQRDLNQARIEVEEAQLALQRTQSQQSLELQMHEQQIRGAREELAGVKLREQAALEQLSSHNRLPEPEGLAVSELKGLKSQVSALRRTYASVRSDMQFFQSEVANIPQQMIHQIVTTIQHQAVVAATDNLSNEFAQAVNKMSAERDWAAAERERVSQERDRALMMLQASIGDARDACMESHMRGAALGILGRLIRGHRVTNVLYAFMKWAHMPQKHQLKQNIQMMHFVAATVVGWACISTARAMSLWKSTVMLKMRYAAAVEKREIQLAEMFCEAEGKRERAEKSLKQLQKKIDAADKRAGGMQGTIDVAEQKLRAANKKLQDSAHDIERAQSRAVSAEQSERNMSLKLQASLSELQNVQEQLAAAQHTGWHPNLQQQSSVLQAEDASKLQDEIVVLQNAHTAAKASISTLTQQLQPAIASTLQLAAKVQMQDTQHESIVKGRESLLGELGSLKEALEEVERIQTQQQVSQDDPKPQAHPMISDSSDQIIISDLQKELQQERKRCHALELELEQVTSHINTFMSECRGPSSSVSMSPSVPRTEILTSEIDELEHQLARASEEKEQLEAQGRDDRDLLVQAIQALELSLHEKQIECDQVREQNDSISTELAESRRKCHSLQATLNELSLQCAKLEMLPEGKDGGRLTPWQAFFLLARQFRQLTFVRAIANWSCNHAVYCQTSRYAVVLRKTSDSADELKAAGLRAQNAACKLAKNHHSSCILARCLNGLMRNAHKHIKKISKSRASKSPIHLDSYHLQRLDKLIMLRDYTAQKRRAVQQWWTASQVTPIAASTGLCSPTALTHSKLSHYEQRLAGVRAIREQASLVESHFSKRDGCPLSPLMA